VSFTAITLCVASQRVFIVVSAYFVVESVQKLLDTLSYRPIYVLVSQEVCVLEIFSSPIRAT
jgi:hypothetical protein